jgi:hypothetical protein
VKAIAQRLLHSTLTPPPAAGYSVTSPAPNQTPLVGTGSEGALSLRSKSLHIRLNGFKLLIRRLLALRREEACLFKHRHWCLHLPAFVVDPLHHAFLERRGVPISGVARELLRPRASWRRSRLTLARTTVADRTIVQIELLAQSDILGEGSLSRSKKCDRCD